MAEQSEVVARETARRKALAKAFAKAAAKRTDADWIQALGEVATEAMWPFYLGEVSVSVYEEGFIDLGRIFRIDIEAVRDHPFIYKFDERVMVSENSPEQFLYDSMAKPLFDHFRYRPSLPVEDHIVLGED